MRGSARLGDEVSGRCFGHAGGPVFKGVIVTASSNVKVNDRPIARIGDKVNLECGHKAVIVGASSDVKSNDRQNARLGDAVSGDGVVYQGEIITASSNVIVN